MIYETEMIDERVKLDEMEIRQIDEMEIRQIDGGKNWHMKEEVEGLRDFGVINTKMMLLVRYRRLTFVIYKKNNNNNFLLLFIILLF
jgi:hypothetical protein